MSDSYYDGDRWVGLTCIRCVGRIVRGDWVAVGYIADAVDTNPEAGWQGAIWHMRCVDPEDKP